MRRKTRSESHLNNGKRPNCIIFAKMLVIKKLHIKLLSALLFVSLVSYGDVVEQSLPHQFYQEYVWHGNDQLIDVTQFYASIELGLASIISFNTYDFNLQLKTFNQLETHYFIKKSIASNLLKAKRMLVTGNSQFTSSQEDPFDFI